MSQHTNPLTLGGLFGTVLDNIAPIGMGVGGLAAINSAYNRLGSIGEQGLTAAGSIAEQTRSDSQFKPFTVKVGSTSGIPSAYTSSQTQFGPAGGLSLDLSAQEQLLKNKLLEDARTRAVVQDAPGARGLQDAGIDAVTRGRTMLSNIPTDTGLEEQRIFDRLQAMQAPEQERERLALEERLFNQGRLGVSTAMFGGTPEQLALAKAQQESDNQAALLAMQQAQQNRLNDANLAVTTLGLGQNLLTGNLGLQGGQQELGLRALEAAYLPQAQALQMSRQGLLGSQLAQRGQLYGADLFGEASMAGLQTLLGAGQGQANLMGAIGTGLLSGALSGGEGGRGSLSEAVSGIGDYLGDYLRQIF